MNLRLKLFAAFCLLIIIPLILLGVSSYYIISKTIEQKYSEQSELTLRALSQTVSFLYQEMDKVTDNTISNAALQNIIHESGKKEDGDTSLNHYLQLKDLQTSFRDLLINHPSVSYSLLYVMNDQSSIPYMDSFEWLTIDKLQGLPLYKEVLALSGRPKWIGPYEYEELTGQRQVFTQIRTVKDVNTLNDIGVLFVQMKGSELESVFRTFRNSQRGKETRFFIVNGNGIIMFDSSLKDQSRLFIEFTTINSSSGEDYAMTRHAFDGQDSLVTSIGLDRENWRLIAVTSWDSLSGEITRYVNWLIAITLLCALSALLFNLVFVNRITKSISRIVRQMRRVEDGDLSVRAEERGNDELFLLARGFNNQVAKVGDLLVQVKREQHRKTRAELRVLQAQIKPHFLFNTLESINALALQNRGKTVSQMVQRLGSILRISIQDKEEITIREELEHLRSYLDIQKLRFGDLFEFNLEMPETYLQYGILKLTLQPLVENCIQHGFEGIEYPGIIRVHAGEENGNLIIWIEDNGLGIRDEVLSKFQYMSPDDDFLHNMPKARELTERRGLGVRNVADRLRIHYGSYYGVMICSELKQGTIMKCIIPKKMPR
ncbi:sensor histidine kinase [Paenibacillus sp. FSL K6-3182]|uniref:sensor histidine kinase n=1 Tax=Paenibacillus sp. FSL K6-3182 TaxID=2921495 RepID=UPI0030CE8C02